MRHLDYQKPSPAALAPQGLHAIFFAALNLTIGVFCFVFTPCMAQVFLPDLSRYQHEKSGGIRSDFSGIQIHEGDKITFSARDQLIVQRKTYEQRAFNDNSLDRTIQKSMGFHFRHLNDNESHLITTFRIQETFQDIYQFTNETVDGRHAQRSFYFTQGYEKSFASRFVVSTHLGGALCENIEMGTRKFFPVASLEVATLFDRGEVSFLVGQQVEGISFFSGLYGNQYRLEASLHGEYRLGKKILASFDCSGSLASQVDGEPSYDAHDTPIFLASAAIDYKANRHLTARLGFTYRHQFDDNPLLNDFGHMTSFSLGYQAF